MRGVCLLILLPALALTWGCAGGDVPPKSTQAEVLALLEQADAEDAVRLEYVQTGANVYARMSCGTCHAFNDLPMTGPRLDRLFDDPVELSDGTEFDADRAYLWRSIATPHAEFVDGYQTATRMSNFGHVLDNQDVAALIAYLESRNGR